jgi:hypothetical protein
MYYFPGWRSTINFGSIPVSFTCDDGTIGGQWY